MEGKLQEINVLEEKARKFKGSRRNHLYKQIKVVTDNALVTLWNSAETDPKCSLLFEKKAKVWESLGKSYDWISDFIRWMERNILRLIGSKSYAAASSLVEQYKEKVAIVVQKCDLVKCRALWELSGVIHRALGHLLEAYMDVYYALRLLKAPFKHVEAYLVICDYICQQYDLNNWNICRLSNHRDDEMEDLLTAYNACLAGHEACERDGFEGLKHEFEQRIEKVQQLLAAHKDQKEKKWQALLARLSEPEQIAEASKDPTEKSDQQEATTESKGLQDGTETKGSQEATERTKGLQEATESLGSLKVIEEKELKEVIEGEGEEKAPTPM